MYIINHDNDNSGIFRLEKVTSQKSFKDSSQKHSFVEKETIQNRKDILTTSRRLFV